jgi:hypothetical protein
MEDDQHEEPGREKKKCKTVSDTVVPHLMCMQLTNTAPPL